MDTLTLDDAASQRQHAADLADQPVWTGVDEERVSGTEVKTALLIRAAVLAEREACAKLAESSEWDWTGCECSGECGPDIARAIRARG